MKQQRPSGVSSPHAVWFDDIPTGMDQADYVLMVARTRSREKEMMLNFVGEHVLGLPRSY